MPTVKHQPTLRGHISQFDNYLRTEAGTSLKRIREFLLEFLTFGAILIVIPFAFFALDNLF